LTIKGSHRLYGVNYDKKNTSLVRETSVRIHDINPDIKVIHIDSYGKNYNCLYFPKFINLFGKCKNPGIKLEKFEVHVEAHDIKK
jgi:hypothetical protein